MSMEFSTTLDRIWSAVVLSAVAHIVFGSTQIGFNLWVFGGGVPALAIAIFYMGTLFAIIVDPDQPGTHSVAAMAGVAFWLGRMGGFIEAMLAGRTELASSVHVRAMIVCMVVLWHLRAVRAIAVRSHYGTD